MADERPRRDEPTLEETAQVVWSVQAMARCGDLAQAKRWAFGKFLAARRRAGPERAVTIPQAVLEAVWWAALFTLVEAEGE